MPVKWMSEVYYYRMHANIVKSVITEKLIQLSHACYQNLFSTLLKLSLLDPSLVTLVSKL